MTSTFAQAQDILAATLPGYTRRPHQEALAAQIELAMEQDRGGMLQAGCGTGKSLAGLIPAILATNEHGDPLRTIVATATKALQTQYVNDLTFLAENLQDFTWAILKGRTNYPCLLKIRDEKSPSPAMSALLAQLGQAGEDEIPDRDTLPAVTDSEWMRLSMSPTECPGKKHCPFGKICIAERAKDKAAESQIVVTNLAYLMIDLLLRQKSEDGVQLLGPYNKLIIDEAHNLPDAATSALSDKLGEATLIRVARDTEGFLHDQRRDTSIARKIADAAHLAWFQMKTLHTGRNEGNREPVPVRLSAKDILSLGEAVTDLAETLNVARSEVLAVKGLDRDDPACVARIRLLNRLGDLSIRLTSVLLAEDRVSWLEDEEITLRGGETKEHRLYLESAPLSPARWLREVIWDAVPALMMSATLTTGTDRYTGQADFTYLRQLVGLKPGEAIEFDAGTPFDFTTQAMLYVPPKGTPEPVGASQMAWQVYTQQATRKLVEAADGNALLLFTSRRAMEASYRALAAGFREAGLLVLKQGDAPTPELIRQLKTGRAVLFGLKTFFEGVDVQGDAVRLVVIDKLPFTVPTDVLIQARQDELARRTGDRWAPFNKLAIPAMSLVLIQGVGRLVRHRDDHGVMAVLDPRLTTKGYGKRIISALPPAPATTDISQAVAYLEKNR
jgi:ATP-dependent DNA helicase DinG